ncbi:MAG: glutathione S-transferase family protein, partial [Cyanobacteriota bacterium]
MLKFYTVKNGGRLTSCVGPSLWLLEETGKPYQVVDIDIFKGEHKSESFLKLNPNGKIPCLQDDNFILWESVAINYYVAAKNKPELLGSNLQERALIDQWVLWCSSELNPPVSAIFTNAMKSAEQRDNNYMQQCK